MIARLLRHPTALAGILILAGVVVMALAASFLAPYDPFQTDLDGSLRGPSAGHIFGQDRLGRDIFSQVDRPMRRRTLSLPDLAPAAFITRHPYSQALRPIMESFSSIDNT